MSDIHLLAKPAWLRARDRAMTALRSARKRDQNMYERREQMTPIVMKLAKNEFREWGARRVIGIASAIENDSDFRKLIRDVTTRTLRRDVAAILQGWRP
jgi:hypothetical protein